MPPVTNNRNQITDIFRLILISMVVAIHVDVFPMFSSLNFFTVDGYFRMAVPIFFIINGYFFQYYVTDKAQFRKWLYRAVLLFVVWQIIYLPMYLPRDGFTAQHTAVFISELLFGYHHLWYIAAMATGGIFLYYLKDAKFTLLLCIALFMIGWFLQYARLFIHTDGMLFKVFSQYWIFRNGLFFGFPMMYIGACIAKNDLIERVSKTACYYFLALSLLCLSLELWLTKNYLFTQMSYHIDFIVSLLVFCPSLFILLMKSDRVYFTHFNSKSLALVASAVYFIHPYVIYFIESYHFTVALSYVLTLTISLLVASVLFYFRKKLFFIF